MIEQTFKSHLTKMAHKNKDDVVVVEFVLSHLSINEFPQIFLRDWDEEFSTYMMSNFMHPDWTNITFKDRITRLKIMFDGLEMIADLVGIKVNKKETKDSIIFKYDLIFNKPHDKDIDLIFATTYLNRKEENEDGKKELLEYDTLIEKM